MFVVWGCNGCEFLSYKFKVEGDLTAMGAARYRMGKALEGVSINKYDFPVPAPEDDCVALYELSVTSTCTPTTATDGV